MKCPYCDEEAVWVENKEIYKKNYGKSYMVWLCKPCDAYVGCHNNTRTPLGTIANKALRTWRMKAHQVIDSFYHSGEYTRNEVYDTLETHFGFKVHIGETDIALCKDLVEKADDILGER